MLGSLDRVEIKDMKNVFKYLSSLLPRRRKIYYRLMTAQQPCMGCGHYEALIMPTKVKWEGIPIKLPRKLLEKFLSKMNGYCTYCGLFQNYNRFDESELELINKLGKDILTEDKSYHTFPPPQNMVDAFNLEYFSQRLSNWRNYFSGKKVAVDKALFLRTMFGASVNFSQDYFGSKCYGLDMSDVCLKYTQTVVPEFTRVDGYLNGYFAGNFLTSGPYDAIFVFHVMVHMHDYSRAVRTIHGLLRPGGFAIFTHETTRKATNPFHQIYPTEVQFSQLLLQAFSRVERIDDCESAYSSHVCPWTVKHDVPDIVAWR